MLSYILILQQQGPKHSQDVLHMDIQADEDDCMASMGYAFEQHPQLQGCALAVSPRVSAEVASESIKMLFMFSNLRQLQLRYASVGGAGLYKTAETRGYCSGWGAGGSGLLPVQISDINSCSQFQWDAAIFYRTGRKTVQRDCAKGNMCLFGQQQLQIAYMKYMQLQQLAPCDGLACSSSWMPSKCGWLRSLACSSHNAESCCAASLADVG